MNTAIIQQIKNDLVASFDAYATEGMRNAAYELVATVRDEAKGFGSKIAATVCQYGRCSEKQAYCIARAYVEEGLTCAGGFITVNH